MTNEEKDAIISAAIESLKGKEELGEPVEKVNRVNASLDANSELSEDAEAFRWASIARTHYQQGSMALTRAVAKPEFF